MTINAILLVLTIMSSQLYLPGHGQVERDIFNATCEFDIIDRMLELDRNYFELLPDGCQAAYNNPELRAYMEYESSKFGEFINMLGTKEKWDEQVEEVGRESLGLNFELRETVYSSGNGNCTMPSNTTNEFLKCMSKYRDDMINALIGTE